MNHMRQEHLSRKTLDQKFTMIDDSDSDIPDDVKQKSFTYYEMAEILEQQEFDPFDHLVEAVQKCKRD